jgi:hypothetical protein
VELASVIEGDKLICEPTALTVAAINVFAAFFNWNVVFVTLAGLTASLK